MVRTWISNQVRKDLSFFDPVFDTIGFDSPVDTTDFGPAIDTIGGAPDDVTVTGAGGAEMPLADQQTMSGPAAPDLFQSSAMSAAQATAASSALQIVDIIPNSDSAESGENSEPSLAVNPLNPAQMIAGTFSATAMSYFMTLNGGATWADYGSLSGDDKSLAWKQDGSAALTATLFPTSGNFGIRTYSGTTTSAGFGSPINTYNPRHDLDQPWIRTGPSNHVYVAYNDLSAAAGKTASVLVSTNGGSTYTPVTLDRVGAGAAVGQDAPSIRLAVNGNTAYAVFTRWNSIIDTDSAGEERFTSQVMVERSDNGGADGFTALGANGNGVQIATPTSWYASTENAPLTIGQERTGGEIAVAVDPNNASHVVVAYGDAPGAMGSAQVKLTGPNRPTAARPGRRITPRRRVFDPPCPPWR
jgi:hypothetical protein